MILYIMNNQKFNFYNLYSFIIILSVICNLLFIIHISNIFLTTLSVLFF